MENSRPHVALLSSPALGHLIPILELGKRLTTQYAFRATVFLIQTPTSRAESQIIAMSSDLIDIVELPPVDITSLVNPNTTVFTRLSVIMREAHHAFRSLLSNMKPTPSILVLDLFGTEYLKLAEEFRMQKYVYFPSNAWFLAATLYTPILDKEVEGEYVEQIEPFRLPGCRFFRPEDVVDPLMFRENQQYREYLRMGLEIPMSDGIIINTWEDIEPISLRALRENEEMGRVINIPIYPIGPLLRPVGQRDTSGADVLSWLDAQPNESVLYVSFGSGGTLSSKQTIEIAWGLELSQQRFVWVLRSPAEDVDGAFLSSGGGSYDPSGFLPDGFIGRIQNKGFLLPLWGPQIQILSHPSVGGFLSHCGWNSTLESIVNGVPMIAWPLYAEQKMNATMLIEELGVAVRAKELPAKGGVVGREEIEKIVRMIMVDEEGKIVRYRMKELKKSAEQALLKEGSSYNSLALVVEAMNGH